MIQEGAETPIGALLLETWCMGLVSPMDDRTRRTEQAALRLIKSRARRAIYRVKSKADSVYERMLYLEQAIEEEALRQWVDVRGLWSGLDRLVLIPLMERILLEVLHEYRAAYQEDRLACQALQRFCSRFNFEEMLG